MRAILLGAGGMLATDLLALAPEPVEVIPLGIEDLDITNPAAIAAALDHWHPAWVVNASAYTQVDRAETEYATALAVNGTAVHTLGALSAARGIKVVHFGTDYVFAGDSTRPYREDDPPSPVNAYGRSKLAGEDGLRASGAHALILRTQWLYGLHGKSFPGTMWARASQRSSTRVVDDQFGSPTWTVDLTRATWTLIAADAQGTYHVANGGVATWFDVAEKVFDAVGSRASLTRCTTDDYPTPARRPRYSVLDTSKLAVDHGLVLPRWDTSLSRFLDCLAERAS